MKKIILFLVSLMIVGCTQSDKVTDKEYKHATGVCEDLPNNHSDFVVNATMENAVKNTFILITDKDGITSSRKDSDAFVKNTDGSVTAVYYNCYLLGFSEQTFEWFYIAN